MIPAPRPADEAARLASLRGLSLLDTSAEERFDRITRLAQTLFDVPIALISLVDENRQWFKSRQGLEADHTSRDVSFCAYAILGSDVFEVPDAMRDDRFRGNALVDGPPDIRFYAGAPLSAPDGRKVGTLCLIDRRPRELTEAQKQILRDLAALVEKEIAFGKGGIRSAPRAAAAARGDRAAVAGFAAALGMMALIAAASYRGARGFAENSRWVTHTHLVIETLGDLIKTAHQEQTHTRGYVITGDDKYRGLFRSASAVMKADLAELRNLISDNPEQLRRLDQVDRLAAQRMSFGARTIELRRERGFTAAAALISTGEPQRAMEELAAAVAEMDAEERRLLALRSAAADADSSELLLIILFGGAAGALIVLAAFLLVRRDIAARAAAERDLVAARDEALGSVEARRRAQAEAERLSERLKAVLDQMDSGVMLVDSGGSVSLFNHAAERIHGAWRDDVDRVMREGKHPPLRLDEMTPIPPAEDPLARALKGETVRDVRLFLRTPFRPAGYCINASAAPLRGAQGLVTGAILVFRDVSDEVRAERRQALQLEVIRLLAQTRLDEDPIPGLLRVVGERLGWPYAGFWRPEAGDRALRAAGQWLAEPAGPLELFARVSSETRLEPGVGLPGRVWKERRAVWISDVTSAQNFPRIDAAEKAGVRAAFAFPVTAGDRCLGVIEVMTGRVLEPDGDMLALVASLGAQIGIFLEGRHAEVERTRFFNLSLDMMCVAGFDGYFKVLNDGWERALGWTKEELMAVPYVEFVHPDDRSLTVKEADRLTDGARTFQFDNRYRCRDGTYKWLSWTSTPVNAEGLIYAAARDVTERRRVTEELAEARDAALGAAKLKSDFLANMSHEIRTPMNAIIGMTGLLMDGSLTPQQRDYVETVRDAGDALLTLINDILDYSKIEAGKMRLESVDFDLRDTAERAVELVAQRAQQKGLEITVSIAPAVPAALRGDAGRLRQILLNLLGNAVKFTESGEIGVTAEAAAAGDRSLVTISVRDTGIGIPVESRARLFQSFSQVDASTTRKYGGTGLGLAISRQLVELMGGRIGVDGEPGKGSRFWIEIPFEIGATPAVTPQSPAPELSSVRAIVVDDNATNREIVRAQLAGWDMSCDAAGGAAEGLALMRRAAKDGRAYGLAILDLQMPHVDGLALAASIKADAALGRPPIILMTSVGNDLDRAEMEAAGLAACLAKPVRRSALYDALLTSLSGRGTTAAPAAAAPETASVRRRVLVVEDNSVNQKVILLQLKKLGHSADAVASGAEAIETLETIAYDLVLMDCQMPEMDGYEATREIRRREAASGRPRIRITALTANVMPEDRAKCFDAGMDGYLSKPVRLDDLQKAITAGPTPVPATAAVEPAPAALKAETVNELLEMAGAEGFKHIRDEFLHSTEASLAKMRAAVDAGDAEALRRAAHTMKGASGSLGAIGLEALCRELEAALASGPGPAAARVVERMAPEFAAVRAAFERF